MGRWVVMLQTPTAKAARLALETSLVALAFDQRVDLVALGVPQSRCLQAHSELIRQLSVTGAPEQVRRVDFDEVGRPLAGDQSNNDDHSLAALLADAARVLSY